MAEPASKIERAARRYVVAEIAHAKAPAGDPASLTCLELELSIHALILATGHACPYCAERTCPALAYDTATVTDPRRRI